MLLIYDRDRYLNPNGTFRPGGCTLLPMDICPKRILPSSESLQLMDTGTVGSRMLRERCFFSPGKQIVPTEADLINAA